MSGAPPLEIRRDESDGVSDAHMRELAPRDQLVDRRHPLVSGHRLVRARRAAAAAVQQLRHEARYDHGHGGL
jgi:hypothetical protein